MTRYVNTADTAKLIRVQLKAKFPGIKFSVRSSVYAGGSSINVDWRDGPTTAMVDAVVKPFAGSGFDGMIDMKYSSEAFLLPDGSATFAQSEGTTGAGGVYSPQKNFKPCVEAERVRFSADYVFTSRKNSQRLVQGALASYRAKYGDEADQIKIGGSDEWGWNASSNSFDVDRRFWEILSRRMIAA